MKFSFDFHPSSPTCTRQILQRVVSQKDAIPGAEALYIRCLSLPDGACRYEADTYMNIFHRARWQKLTNRENMALEVTCCGKGRLLLLGSHPVDVPASLASTPFRELASYDVDTFEESKTYTVRLSDDYDFYSLAWEEKAPHSLDILEAAYTEMEWKNRAMNYPAPSSLEEAENLDESHIRIALVVTTYQRVDDVTRLVSLYRAACLKSADFSKSSHLFIVNNNPNDVEALSLISDSQLTLLNNSANFGGAGGFSRGAQEAATQGGFSHVLFMDDDAQVHEETWFRTLSLLRRLCAPYSDQIISGAMFTQECPTWCHVMQEGLTQKGLGVTISGNQDLSSSHAVLGLIGKVRTYPGDPKTDILLVLKKNQPSLRVKPDSLERPYAAWWYCVIPIGLFHEYGYPLPVFFRGDDQEFGMRIQRIPLPLNGICVWHPAFENKKSLLRLYLGCRNNSITNLLHFRHWRINLLQRMFFNISRELANYRYPECAARILAFHNFLRFDRIPKDGEQLIPRVNKWCDRFKITPNPSTHDFIPQKQNFIRNHVLDATLIYLTLGGALIPKSLHSDVYSQKDMDAQRTFCAAHAIHLALASILLFIVLIACRRRVLIQKITRDSVKTK